MKGGALPRTMKLTFEKIASLVKKPYAGKPKTNFPSIQSLKYTKPKSVTKVSTKKGALSSIKKLTVEKIASLVRKPFVKKPKIEFSSI